MGWTEVWQYSKLVKCPLENQYFASYIAIAAVYFERICMYTHHIKAQLYEKKISLQLCAIENLRLLNRLL